MSHESPAAFDYLDEVVRLQGLLADEREAHEKAKGERDYWRDLAGGLKADKRELKAELKRLRAENEKAARFMAAFGAKP